MKIQSSKAGIGTGRAGLQAASGLFSSAGLFQKGVKSFDPNDLDPYLLFDAGDSMLDDSLETASFLEPVPVLRNLARGSNKGGDAEQDVALNQPKALPLIDGDGYLYLSGVAGNYAEVNSPILPATGDFDVSVDLYYTGSTGGRQTIFSQYDAADSGRFFIYIDSSNYLSIFWGGTFYVSSTVVPEGRNTIRVTKSGNTVTTYLNGVQAGSATRTGLTQVNLLIGIIDLSGTFVHPFKGAIFSVTEANGLLNCDFTATAVRHGDTKFQAAVGGDVTINQSGNDPATIIKKPVLRFDGVNDALRGVFANNINGGYMFAAFSVLGTGGEGAGRTFTINRDSYEDYTLGGALFCYHPLAEILRTFSGGIVKDHTGLFDDSNRDILHEAKITNGNQLSKVNNADLGTTSISYDVNSNKFNIAANESDSRADGENTAIDLEYLALFPASITDEQADAVRNYINNRNNVFDLKDGFGYYFFDPQSLADGAVTSWNGRIIGSDNGDADKLATQATAADQPTSDGYKVTFADSTDHLEIPSTTQAGWQVVGTSLGTFVYKVDSDAVTELNLLGNLGSATSRKAGDLYGIILLPENATNRDIEEARKLLIDRGAADGVTATNLFTFWFNRNDIREFKNVDTSSVISFRYAWKNCTSLQSFPLLDATNAISFEQAFFAATSLSSFPAIQAPLCTSFSSAWRNCSSLAQFPSGAKLGTEASNVNFESAWRTCSSLTSFPEIDVSSGTNFQNAWLGCSSLTSFPAVDVSSGTNFQSAWYNCSSLTSFPEIDTSSGTTFSQAWFGCSSLTSFPAIDTSSGTNFSQAWRNCTSLTSFPLLDTSSGTNFTNAWYNCSSLTSFPLLDTSSGTTFQSAWYNCSSLTSFPEIDTSSGTNFLQAWFGCSSLTSFPLLDTSSGANFTQAWFGCSSLTSFPAIDTSSGTNFYQAWRNCTSLTSFPLLDTSSGTTFQSAWQNCSSLVAFPKIDTSSGEGFSNAWRGCSSLVAFPKIDTSSGTNFVNAWLGCSSLKSFPANFFDSWSPASVSSGVFNVTWTSCSSLTAQSVENILTSIAASGKYATSTGLSGGTALADATIDIDYNVATGSLTAATLTAIESLNGRGWSVNINGVIQ